jgi:hypothetical protein
LLEKKRHTIKNEIMKSEYQESQRSKSIKRIKDNNPVFCGGQGGGFFKGSKREFILTDGLKNIYEPIRNDVIKYFSDNKISWWGGENPTGHVLSSQIACLNHLFPLRNDRNAVLEIVKSILPDFVDVFEIETDKLLPGFIQFEAVSDNDHLNEGTPSRGANCTSVDALIYALHKDGSKWLIPIEWKYTEFYNEQNKAIEGFEKDPDNCKGEVRKRRYTDLINRSVQLKNYDHTCYYYEPFYQLMRQTLWAEQMIANKDNETIKADNYLHIHVIPEENKDLLEKIYQCSGLNMEATWRNHLKNQGKYLIITPRKLLSTLDPIIYKDLIHYLSLRYW